MADSPSDAELIFRRLEPDDDGHNLFDRLTTKLDAMGLANPGANGFQQTFERVIDEKSKKWIYITRPGGTLFTANIVFEVGSASQGTQMAAYPVKNPQIWLKRIKRAVSESTGREDSDKTQPADLISLCLLPLYEKPFGNRSLSPPRRVRNSRVEVDVEMANVDQTAAGELYVEMIHAPILARKVGNAYPLNMMSDHKGTYFNHVKAMMPQHDYKDKDGNLIAPHEYYKKLREGTLVLAKVSLSFYTFKDRNPKFLDSKIYHVNVEKLTILDPGNGLAWDPEIPTLPGIAPSTPSTNRIWWRVVVVDDAFDDASPSKKPHSG
ncbi:hypothetical protein B0H10DRAFT_1967463 [Mycena sp. CBHHK59/15]|nr:hypothetical protein B0H10DRAFT_1967463 [Mycena sp. CBHHK59/15]